jgi:4-phospho-D-threonate 3-dehydrogenase / 4-phospho-D-erythronate 3-dehydrogenase
MIKPIIAVTMGDPAGVGPEVTIKALTAPEIRRLCFPVALGNLQVFQKAARRSHLPIRIQEITDVKQIALPGHTVGVLNCTKLEMTRFKPGISTAQTGRAALEAVQTAARLAVTGGVSAITTSPISKEAIRAAGCPHPGHTELLAELTASPEVGMLMVAPIPRFIVGAGLKPVPTHLRILLVTTHVSIKELPKFLTTERVLMAIRLASMASRQYFGLRTPKIAVAGLNPHAGEGGFLGSEEQQIIDPAIERARQMGHKVSGPFPADTLMLRVIQGAYDMVVAMYHDQALIPIKLLSFGKAVNVTVGLPFIRTSVDHGTASDIAWKGKADPGSLIAAIQLAAQLSSTRKHTSEPKEST